MSAAREQSNKTWKMQEKNHELVDKMRELKKMMNLSMELLEEIQKITVELKEFEQDGITIPKYNGEKTEVIFKIANTMKQDMTEIQKPLDDFFEFDEDQSWKTLLEHDKIIYRCWKCDNLMTGKKFCFKKSCASVCGGCNDYHVDDLCYYDNILPWFIVMLGSEYLQENAIKYMYPSVDWSKPPINMDNVLEYLEECIPRLSTDRENKVREILSEIRRIGDALHHI